MRLVTEPWEILKSLYNEWAEDRVSRLAAALAYYAIFAIAPLLVIAVWMAGLVFGPQAARLELAARLEQTMGAQGAETIQRMVINAGRTGSGWAAIVGIILLIYGSTNVFASLQDAMDTVWEVQPRPDRPWLSIIQNRLWSFVMVIGVGILLLASLVLSTALAAVAKYAATTVPGWFWWIVNEAASLLVFALIFAAIYKFLPDVKVRWRSVWIGAMVTALFFEVGKYLLGLYLGRASATSVYGAAGSLVAVLMWMYYEAQIFLIGAEFTQVYARRYHQRAEPEPQAVKLSESSRIQQGMPHARTVAKAAGVPADSQRPPPGRNVDFGALGAKRGRSERRAEPW